MMIRLLELRMEKGLSQRAIAQQFNVSQGTYNNWERSNTQPSIEQLIALARFFDVSVDYLIGNTDYTGVVKIVASLPESHRKMLEAYTSLPPDIQNCMLKIVQTCTAKEI